VVYFFKEGGGGGFHSRIRLYPTKGIASVVMVNSTEFDSTNFLYRVEGAFFDPYKFKILRGLTPTSRAYFSLRFA